VLHRESVNTKIRQNRVFLFKDNHQFHISASAMSLIQIKSLYRLIIPVHWKACPSLSQILFATVEEYSMGEHFKIVSERHRISGLWEYILIVKVYFW